MGEKCELFSCCPLRIFYESSGNNSDWLKRYCNSSRFRDCGRYKLEALGQSKNFGMPKKIKRPGRKRTGKRKIF